MTALDKIRRSAERDEVKVAIWYTLMDTNFDVPSMPWENYFGLFRQDHSPKPAAVWLRARSQGEQVFLPLVVRE